MRGRQIFSSKLTAVALILSTAACGGSRLSDATIRSAANSVVTQDKVLPLTAVGKLSEGEQIQRAENRAGLILDSVGSKNGQAPTSLLVAVCSDRNAPYEPPPPEGGAPAPVLQLEFFANGLPLTHVEVRGTGALANAKFLKQVGLRTDEQTLTFKRREANPNDVHIPRIFFAMKKGDFSLEVTVRSLDGDGDEHSQTFRATGVVDFNELAGSYVGRIVSANDDATKALTPVGTSCTM